MVGILGLSAAPALLTGLAVSSFMGAMYELITSGTDAHTPEAVESTTTPLEPSSHHSEPSTPSAELALDDATTGDNSLMPRHELTGEWSEVNSGSTPMTEPTTEQVGEESQTNQPTQPAQTPASPGAEQNDTSSEEMVTVFEGNEGWVQHPDGTTETGLHFVRTFERGEQAEDGSYSWTDSGTVTDGNGEEHTKTYTYSDTDNNNNGVPDGNETDDDESSQDLNDEDNQGSTTETSQTPNPEGQSSDQNHDDGRYDDLIGFRGDIDPKPEGNAFFGYTGEHDHLKGFDGSIDFGPDGQPGESNATAHDDLINFNGKIDWDHDHGDEEFSGNALTDLLGGIDPKMFQDAMATTDLVGVLFAGQDPLA